MKIYTLDLGWEGAIIAMAENEEAARKIMAEKSRNYKYNSCEELKENDLDNFFFENLGDS